MTKIKSTVLINKNALFHISGLSQKNRTTTSKLIERILLEMIKLQLSTNKVKIFSSVKYQNRGGEYALVHYSTDPSTYESLLDIRKIAKLSISRMLSDFIMNYLNDNQNIERFFAFHISKRDRNQINYIIMSHFNIINQTLNLVIKAKLE